MPLRLGPATENQVAMDSTPPPLQANHRQVAVHLNFGNAEKQTQNDTAVDDDASIEDASDNEEDCAVDVDEFDEDMAAINQLVGLDGSNGNEIKKGQTVQNVIGKKLSK